MTTEQHAAAGHTVLRRPGAREHDYCLTCGERMPLPMARPRWLERAAAKDLTEHRQEVTR